MCSRDVGNSSPPDSEVVRPHDILPCRKDGRVLQMIMLKLQGILFVLIILSTCTCKRSLTAH